MPSSQRAQRVPHVLRSPGLLAPALLSLLGGCSVPQVVPQLNTPAIVAPATVGQRDLIYLPPPPQPIPVAVYSFTDQTGQLKASDSNVNYSRAITQGGTSILISALRSAGNGNWFTVIERERLDNLLKERQIIREMRKQYIPNAGDSNDILPSLTFAGVTLEGGIISYDQSVKSGGIGARFLGIGASTQYRTNTATVYLRAISVKTGEVLANVVTQKSIASYATSAGVFKYVRYDGLLEGEVGVAANEPSQLAVQGAIEKAVYALVLEGAKPGPKQLWNFADAKAGQGWIDRYDADRARSLAAVYGDQGGLPTGQPKK